MSTGNELPGKPFKTENCNSLMPDKRLVFQKGKQRKLFTFFFDNGWSRVELCEQLGVAKSTLKDYFNERNNIRLSTFQQLADLDKGAEEFKVFIEKQLPLNWGAKKGGFATAQLLQNKNSHYSKLREIGLQKEIVLAKKRKQGIETHPLIEQMKKDGVDLKAVLAVCLLTDGSMQVYGEMHRISYGTKDTVLQNLLFSLMNELSFRIPKISFAKKANLVRVNDGILGKQLLSLSPNYKTCPSRNQTKEQYLQEPQPTLNFLFNASEKTKIWALRFAFSADGSISLPIKSCPSLDLACYHPTLPVEWKEFIEIMGFKPKLVRKNKSWCGQAGVRMQTHESFKKFLELGGFINGVKISKKSKRYCGMTKNALLQKVVENGHGRI